MYGKIARLACDIREELNRRLDDNEPGDTLLAWLNRLPEVKAVLQEQFGGVPISKQNLSEWRAGGFARWRAQREFLTQARDMAEDASELNAEIEGRLTDHLATVLAVRYASVLSNWDGTASEAIQGQLKSLHGLCRDVVGLRRGDYHCTRLRLEEQREERERTKSEEEMLEHFEKWLSNPEVRKLTQRRKVSPSERSFGRGTQKGTNHRGTETQRKGKAAGRLRKLFGVQPDGDQSEPDGQTVKSEKMVGRSPSPVSSPQGEDITLAAPGHESASGSSEPNHLGRRARSDAPYQPQVRGRSKSVKHSQTSDGATAALQKLDAVLEKNTKPVITESEKTLHFMRTLFGDQMPAHVVEKYEKQIAKERGLTGDKTPPEAAPGRAGRATKKAINHRDTEARRPDKVQAGEPSPHKAPKPKLEGSGQKEEVSEVCGNAGIMADSTVSSVGNVAVADAGAPREVQAETDAMTVQTEWVPPPPPNMRRPVIVRSRRIESTEPVDRTRDSRGEPLY
jgi:hypothetical protein